MAFTSIFRTKVDGKIFEEGFDTHCENDIESAIKDFLSKTELRGITEIELTIKPLNTK